MDSFDFNPKEIVNVRDRFNIPPKKNLEPKRDDLISRILGKPILQSDPRLLRLIVKYKNGKKGDSTQPDNFLENPKFIKELKEEFNKGL